MIKHLFKILFFLVMCCLFLETKAQSLSSDFIITLSGDTIKGKISSNVKSLIKEIKFITQDNTEKSNTYPSDSLRGFYSIKEGYFEATSFDDSTLFKRYPSFPLKQRLFISKLVSGKYNLYKFSQKDENYFILTSDSLKIVLSPTNYRGVFSLLFQNNAEIVKRIKEINFISDDLKQTVYDYNISTFSSGIYHGVKSKNIIIKAGGHCGINYPFYDPKKILGNGFQTPFKIQNQITYGFFLELKLSQRFFVIAESNFYKYDITFEPHQTSVKDIKSVILWNLEIFQISSLVGYDIVNFKRLTCSLMIGPNLGIATEKNLFVLFKTPQGYTIDGYNFSHLLNNREIGVKTAWKTDYKLSKFLSIQAQLRTDLLKYIPLTRNAIDYSQINLQWLTGLSITLN